MTLTETAPSETMPAPEISNFINAPEVTLRTGRKNDDLPISPKTKWEDDEPRTGTLQLDEKRNLIFTDQAGKATNLGPASNFRGDDDSVNSRMKTLYSQDHFQYRYLSIPKPPQPDSR